MKMGFRLVFILLLFLFSCDTDDTENENPCGGVLCTLYCANGYVLDENGCEMCQCIVSVFAGVYDDTFNHYALAPPLEIERIWDSENLYFQGEAFIDIDLDGSHDFKFEIGGYNEKKINDYPEIFNHCLLTPFNGFEIAYDTETFYGGMGFVANSEFVRKLDFNEGIDELSTWNDGQWEVQNGEHVWVSIFYENPNNMPYGSWYYATDTHYIAIKNNDKYGWIEVDMSDGYFPKIISYAIEQ